MLSVVPAQYFTGLRSQKISGLEYWVQLLFNFTPVSVTAMCRPGLIATIIVH